MSFSEHSGAGETPALDYLIIGAGPAGLQVSYFLARAGLSHRVLERAGAPGAFFRAFPRHRKLISINKVHTGIADPEVNLRWDWNSLLADGGRRFTELTPRYFPHADDMPAYLAEFAETHGLPIEREFEVARVERGVDGRFRVTSRDGRERLATRLVVATGVSKPWRPSFPGVELCDCYTTVSVRPEDYTNQRVLIIGKGNSAFETADNLMETAASIHVASPHPLRLAWRTHFVGHLRAVNNNLLDSYQLKSQNAVLDAEVREVRREGAEYVATLAYSHADSEVEALRYDRVITCTGFRFDASIFAEDCRPSLDANGRLPTMTSEWESTSVPDLFFAGTLMQYRDYKKHNSGFIHGFRYNIRALARVFGRRYHARPWPAAAIPSAPGELCAALLGRANRSSALWQQPGFLCDLIQLPSGGGAAQHLEELPVDLALESFAAEGEWLMLTLEFGPSAVDPFNVPRIHRSDARRAELSTFLHPIVRHYAQGALVAEHHVIEDLGAEWREPEHVAPLTEFLASLAPAHGAARRSGPVAGKRRGAA